MHDDMTKLRAAVAGSRTVIASARALISGLAQRLRDALDNDDTDALNALAEELMAETDGLAEDVAANTSAQNEPELPEGADETVGGGAGEDTTGGAAGEDDLGEGDGAEFEEVDETSDDGANNTQ